MYERPESVTCEVCGRPIPTKRVGRLALAHPKCAQLTYSINRLWKALDAALVGADDDLRRRLRREIGSRVLSELAVRFNRVKPNRKVTP